MSFVLDASAALAFVFPDERDAAAISLAGHLRRTRAFAPLLWRWEMENAITLVERRGRVTTELATRLLENVAKLPVQLDLGDSGHILFARRFGLSIYDALYLDLAFRKQLPLATRDAQLLRAAQRLGVEILDPEN